MALDFSCDAPTALLILGISQVSVILALGIYIKRSRYLASIGNKNASDVLVLPIYNLVFIYALIASLLVAADNILAFDSESVYIISVKWILYRSCAEGVAFFLMHNGVGHKSLMNSIIYAVTWSIFTTIIPLTAYFFAGESAYFLAVLIFFVILFFFYCILWLSPARRLHRRPAAIRLARYYVFTCAALIVVTFLILVEDSTLCLVRVVLALSDLFQPIIILRALSDDSKFWQG